MSREFAKPFYALKWNYNQAIMNITISLMDLFGQVSFYTTTTYHDTLILSKVRVKTLFQFRNYIYRKVFFMNVFNIMDKPKELKYVTVYNQLFKMINEGIFVKGSRLPSEPELSKMIGVSRTTLRQALALLQEDGLVKNIHGKGNFIIKSKNEKIIGLEKIGHPVYKCIDQKIDVVEISIRIEPSTDYIDQTFGRKTTAVALIDRWYKFKDKAIAYTFTLIPIDTVSNLDIDLNEQDKVLKILEEDIYEICDDILLELKYSTSGNFAAKKYQLSHEDQFYLIQETLYKGNKFPIISNKHYLPIESSSIKFHPLR
ncbi:putative transcriptional regulator (GntR family) [Clostridium tetani]|uniref:Transcriptional regulator (GntR family) n=2 Tax=Clostridium tetani TaxID=1513 RepID=A0ABC8EDQ0_CLOTA|nr:putative transcriptional regulator (GntR family) [Clostridium tetani]BDR81081.1 putative transcriptional regulator (GntR family) [Clostridium tetani]BDR89460.1 putative transcriptional regulator (GntR family) [Clostridium tetani]CDI49513.1 transcriptional regulatory protein [Clostridium tetani 12124569]